MGLKELFWESGDTPAKPTKPAAAPRVNTALRSPMPANSPARPSGGKRSTKFSEHFDRKFDSMNLAGPDYYEWCKGEEAMAAQLPDANSRRIAAFSMLKTQGLTRAILLESAAKYRAAVDADITTYEQAVAAKEANVIGPKRIELEQARASIQREQAEIERLQQAIAAREGAIVQMENDLAKEEASLNEAKSEYAAARAEALDKLDQDVAYITTNITD